MENIRDEINIIMECENRLFLQPLINLATKLYFDKRLECAWQLIQENYIDTDFDLETAALVSGISKNHLNVMLRKTIGLTFHQLLVRHRLLKAILIMKTRNYTLLEIAFECGFGSFNAFERNFRLLLGTTPKKFRNLLIQNKNL